MERLYRLLLRLYPRRFREEYGRDLIQALRDRRAEARYRGLLGRGRLLAFVISDLLRSVALQWIRRAGAGGATTAHGAREGPASPHHEGRTTTMTMGNLVQDLRVALRSYRRRPGFFLAAVTTLALGVGASTTVFSVVDGVLLRPLPYEEPDELVEIGTRYEGFDGLASTSPPDFFDWQEEVESLEAMAASRLEALTFLGTGEPVAVEGAGVSAEFFEVLKVEPARGRAFTPAEDEPGAEPVAVLSHGAWQRLFGGDPAILGRRLDMGERTFTVVGVMPADFHPPEAIHHQDVEMWYPLVQVDDPLDDRRFSFLQAMGRLRDDASLESAREELRAVGRRIAEIHPESAPRTPGLEPLYGQTVAGAEDAFNLIVGAVVLLLLIACANVANLFLVRATEREREMAVRASLGAGRRRLSGQLLVEALVLTLLAGLAGVGVAYAGVEAFRLYNPGGLPRLAEVGITGRVLAFAVGLSILTGVVFGLVPALHLREGRLGEALRERSGGGGGGGSRSRVRSLLVVAQTGLAVVLVTGAGVLANSFVRLTRVDPGFEPEGAAWVAVRLHEDEVADAEAAADIRTSFFREVERRLEALPGVTAVGSTTNLPMTDNESRRSVTPEGMELGADERPPGWSYHLVTPGFFRALRVPLLRGRRFAASDDMDAPRVAIVNEALADRYWPGEDPLGKRFKFGRPEDESPWVTVVGVVGDVRQFGLASPEPPHLYMPYAQEPRVRMVSVVRAENAATLLQPMREAVREVDPTLPLEQFGTMTGEVAASVVEPRFYALLLGVFGGVALVLAFVGIYGTLAYTVERRTHELGVRMAMGAGRRHVLGLVVRRGMALTAVGIVIGVGAALASGRVLEAFVFGIEPTDPETMAVVVAGLTAVALVACWLPARRAASLDPARTLREE